MIRAATSRLNSRAGARRREAGLRRSAAHCQKTGRLHCACPVLTKDVLNPEPMWQPLPAPGQSLAYFPTPSRTRARDPRGPREQRSATIGAYQSTALVDRAAARRSQSVGETTSEPSEQIGGVLLRWGYLAQCNDCVKISANAPQAPNSRGAQTLHSPFDARAAASKNATRDAHAHLPPAVVIPEAAMAITCQKTDAQ